MQMLMRNFTGLCALLFLFVLTISSCDDDDLTILQPTASFTVTVMDLTVTTDNTSTNAESFIWDFGDGNTSTETSPEHTYAEEGDYTITLTATGVDGSSPANATEDVTVTDPVPPNLIRGGSFEANDASEWSILHSGQANEAGDLEHVKYAFGYTDYAPSDGTDGSLYIFPDNDASNGEEGTLFYQQITGVEAGTYNISALVRVAGESEADPTSAMNQYWFEIVVWPVEPTEGDGYNYDRNTGWIYGGWTGWAYEVPVLNGPIPHDYLAANRADADGNFDLEAGDYYVVIKVGKGGDTGGASFGDGIALDDLRISKVE